MSRVAVRKFGQIALTAAFIFAVFAVGAQAATDYTWTGAGTSTDWSNAANWAGGTAPSGSVGTLTFPELTSAACTAAQPTAVCYGSANTSEIAVTGLSIDDNQPYAITADQIDLGSGGLTASADTSAEVPSSPTEINGLLALTAPQTWTIDGGAGQEDGVLVTNGGIVGNQPLTVDFTNGGTLETSADIGALTASGPGTLIPGSGGTVGGSINGSGGGTVTLENGAQLAAVAPGTSVGALSATDADIAVGSGSVPEGTLDVNGALSAGSDSEVDLDIDQPGTTAGTGYSALSVTGSIDLTGADLDLAQGTNDDDDCSDLNPGDVDTLLSTTGGTLTGQFANADNGTTVTIENDCDSSTEAATATINYTATSVTATIVSAGNAGDVPQNPSGVGISGNPYVGNTLTAVTGTWTGNPTFTYQWVSCTTTACSDIAGATSSTYVPTTADIGDELVVVVTATNADGNNSNYSQATAPIGDPVPAILVSPAISGTAAVGATLTATVGYWSNDPTGYSYQWLLCNDKGSGCAPITGATADKYVPTGSDVGQSIALDVVASNLSGNSTAAQSPPTGQIAATSPVPALVRAPKAQGSAVVGQTLTATGAEFTGSSLTYKYEWGRCTTTALSSCTLIKGATTASYTLTSADAGYRVGVLIDVYNTLGNVYGISPATAIVLTVTQVKSTLTKLFGPIGSAATTVKVLKTGGYSVRYVAPALGVLSVTWTASVKGHRTTIATAKKTLTAGEAVKVNTSLTAAGKRLLRTSKQAVKLTEAASFKLPAGSPLTASKSVTLRR